MSFDLEFERDVLAQACVDADFLRTALPVLSGHNFSSAPNAWIWRTLAETWTKSSELPTSRLFVARAVRDFGERPELRDRHLAVLKSLYSRRPSAPKAALEEVRRYARLAHLRRAAEGLVAGLDKGDLEAAETSAVASLYDVRALSALEEPRSFEATIDDRIARYSGVTEAVIKFPMPLPRLQTITGGGINEGGLALAFAQAGTGKSTWVVDVGFCVLLNLPTAHVLHLTTEESREDVEARYDARICGLERRRLISGELDEAEAELARLRLHRASGVTSRLAVQEVEAESPASHVRAVAERKRRQLGPGVPLLLIIDSPDHLSATGLGRDEAAHVKVGSIYQGLKAVARDSAIGPAAIWAVTWAPVTYENKKPTVNAVAGSVQKGRIADFMLHMKAVDDSSDESKTFQALRFDVVKSRYGRMSRTGFTVSANLGTCEFTEGEVDP